MAQVSILLQQMRSTGLLLPVAVHHQHWAGQSSRRMGWVLRIWPPGCVLTVVCWLCSCRALRARDELVGYFQAGITEARQQMAQGQELKGVLGRLVAAVDEEGNT